jgi:plasmid stabilization system protein ParE
MTRVELAPESVEDFERILQHLLEHDVEQAESRIQQIVRAIDVLASNPLIGRPARTDLRELVIGRRSTGYVALYRYIAEVDTVFVLSIRAQKEAGYK